MKAERKRGEARTSHAQRTAPPRRGRLAIALVIVAATAALTLGVGVLVGCSPQPAPQTGTPSAAEDAAGIEGMAAFWEQDAGDYPDTTFNTRYVNADRRGCNSCHEDMQSVIENSGLAHDHPVPRSGYNTERNLTILDGCLSCHAVHTSDYGNYFADAIHVAHYGNAGFVSELGGNCFSCHSITDTADLTKLGTTEMRLWEQVMYDGSAAGYPDIDDNEITREFMKFNGHASGYNTDIAVDEAPEIKVDLSQKMTENVQDMFVALNHSGMYGEEVADESHTVTLSGVKNPREFTLDDLRGMPQTTVKATNQCVVAGSAGHNIYNAEYTGVRLQDLVDACGGLEDGVNQLYITGWDEWNCCGLNQPIEDYLPNGLVAIEMNGEPVTYEFGGPMLFVAPGTGGAFWCKFVKTFEFSQGEAPFDFVKAMADQVPGDVLNDVSGAWFQNDGVQAKVGEPVALTGYGYALATSVAPLAAVEFSTDFGAHWTRVDVPADFDPLQWTTFDFSWTPKEAGTYIVKVRGVNADGKTNVVDGSIIVNVEG